MTTRTVRRRGDGPLPGRNREGVYPDVGCWAAASCLGCPWARCVMLMPPAERRIFTLAWRTLETFRAPPDRALAD